MVKKRFSHKIQFSNKKVVNNNVKTKLAQKKKIFFLIVLLLPLLIPTFYIFLWITQKAQNNTDIANAYKSIILSENVNIFSVPKILHQTGKDWNSLKPIHKEFYQECDKYYSTKNGWKHWFWNDSSINIFVKNHHTNLYKQFINLKPQIRRVDTVRYLWMYTYGGIYIDLDTECLRDGTSFINGLYNDSIAYNGGYPEPFFMMSSPQNPFWLFMVNEIFNTWELSGVRDTTGPQGLQKTLKKYINIYGKNILAPFIMNDESECQRIKPKNDVKCGEKTYRWYTGMDDIPDSEPDNIVYKHRISFIPNQIIDPTACLASIGSCRHSHCHDREDIKESGALFVHHCHESWGGEGIAQQQKENEQTLSKY